MSDEKFVTENEAAPKLEPVETKDHTNEPVLTETPKTIGRPKGSKNKVKKEPKVELPVRKWRCATCQEVFDDKNVMKIGAGTNRYAVFCPMCQKSLGFEDPVVLDTVAALIKNNPTGKNAKA